MALVVGNWRCHWLLSFSFTDFDATMSLPMPLSEMSNFYSATVFKGHRQTCRHSNFWCGNRIAPSKEGCRNIPCGVSGFGIGHSDATFYNFLQCTFDTLIHLCNVLYNFVQSHLVRSLRRNCLFLSRLTVWSVWSRENSAHNLLDQLWAESGSKKCALFPALRAMRGLQNPRFGRTGRCYLHCGAMHEWCRW